MATNQNKEQDTHEEETNTDTQQSNNEEKVFTQSDVNKLLAKEKRTWQTKYDSLKSEHDELVSQVETERTQKETQLKTKLQDMKKGLAPAILDAVEAIEEFSVEKAIAYLEKPENKIDRKKVPSTPNERESDGNEKSKIRFDPI